MSMTFPYCNTISDLQMVFKDIEKFNGLTPRQTFVAESGNVYRLANTGLVGNVQEDNVALTLKTSIAEVEAAAGSFWYDSTLDILYMHSTDSADPDTHTIQTSEYLWSYLKSYHANRAFQQMESMLDPVYPRPLPFTVENYNEFNYDSDIVMSAALLTCLNIIQYRDSENPMIPILQKRVWWNVEDEEQGILWEYRKGQRSFSFETTKDQFDGNIKQTVKDDNSTGLIQLVGSGDRSERCVILLYMSKSGAVGTAEYKYSINGGTTYTSAILSAYNYVHLVNGIYLKMSGTFVLDDAWQIDIAGGIEQVTNPSIKTINLKR